MKTKKLAIGVLVASLLVSLCLLCFSSYNLIAKAEDTTSSTVDSVVDEEVVTENLEDKVNNQIKDWLGLVFSIGDTALGALLLALISKKKNEPVTVTVNDAETQTQLKTITNENKQLHNLLVDMFQLQKGTFEVLKTIFAENTSLDDKVRGTIKQIALQEEDIIKDFQDVLDAETHKKIKTSLTNISNIILG